MRLIAPLLALTVCCTTTFAAPSLLSSLLPSGRRPFSTPTTTTTTTEAATTVDCSLVRCAEPQCTEGSVPFIGDGECCPSCVDKSAVPNVDCRVVRCGLPKCEEGFVLETKEGECCPTCVEGSAAPNVDCAVVLCAMPRCADGHVAVTKEGECCPTCVEDAASAVDCSAVDCPMYKCMAGHVLMTPEGECCPVCTATASTTAAPATVTDTPEPVCYSTKSSVVEKGKLTSALSINQIKWRAAVSNTKYAFTYTQNGFMLPCYITPRRVTVNEQGKVVSVTVRQPEKIIVPVPYVLVEDTVPADANRRLSTDTTTPLPPTTPESDTTTPESLPIEAMPIEAIAMPVPLDAYIPPDECVIPPTDQDSIDALFAKLKDANGNAHSICVSFDQIMGYPVSISIDFDQMMADEEFYVSISDVIVGETVTAPECVTMCPMMYAPVCGSDGNTYGSACQLSARNCQNKETVAVVHDGECDAPVVEEPAPECVTMCPMMYAPVCGSDGITYGNMCQLDAHNCQNKETITVVHDGECDAPAHTPEETQACPAGCSVWSDGCNECQCVSEGVVGACTERACFVAGTPMCMTFKESTDTITPPSLPPVDLVEETQACPAGCTVWSDGCNECKCDGEGKVGGCTRRMCIAAGTPMCVTYNEASEATPPAPPAPKPTPEETQACPAGCTVWSDGCNECQCVSEGVVGGCTKRMCFAAGTPKCLVSASDASKPSRPVKLTLPTLKPVRPTNTPEGTPHKNEEGGVCPEGCVSWFDGCNHCTCASVGVVGGCTRMACLSPSPEAPAQQPKCAAFATDVVTKSPSLEACADVACIMPVCEQGFILHNNPGDCCPTCVAA